MSSLHSGDIVEGYPKFTDGAVCNPQPGVRYVVQKVFTSMTGSLWVNVVPIIGGLISADSELECPMGMFFKVSDTLTTDIKVDSFKKPPGIQITEKYEPIESKKEEFDPYEKYKKFCIDEY